MTAALDIRHLDCKNSIVRLNYVDVFFFVKLHLVYVVLSYGSSVCGLGCSVDVSNGSVVCRVYIATVQINNIKY